MADVSKGDELPSEAPGVADTEPEPPQPPPQPSPPAAKCVIPYVRNDNFVDRAHVFDSIHSALDAASDNRNVALWGPGGCGKTHIAVEHAYRHNAANRPIFWVHAENETTFYLHFYQIALELGLDNGLKGDFLLTAVRGKLESLQNWLLVLDCVNNADLFRAATADSDCGSLRKYIPETSTGSVIWTSRSQSTVEAILGSDKGIEVGHLTDEEALELIQVDSGELIPKDQPENAVLFEELGWFPMAISLAASYLRVSEIPVPEYLTKLAEATQQLGIEKDDIKSTEQNAMDGVLKAWHVSAQKIQEDDQHSKDMAHILSYLHNRKIPFDLLAGAWKQITQGDDDASQEKEAKECAKRLCEFSILKPRDSNNRNFEMSQILQEAVRYSLQFEETAKEDPTRFLKVAIQVISDAFQAGKKRGNGKYMPHALTVEPWAEESGKEIQVSELLGKVSDCLQEYKIWGAKERVDKRVVELCQKGGGEDDSTLPDLLATLAATYEEQGHYDQAIKIRSDIIDRQSKRLGERSSATIRSMKKLAKSQYRQGQFAEAEDTCHKVIGMQTEILGPKNKSTLRGMEILGVTYRKQGRLDESRDVYAKILEVKRESMGETNKSTIESMQDLAAAECRLGNHQENERLRAEIMDIQQKLHGEQHKDAISAMAYVAVSYHYQQRHEEAAELRLEVLNRRRELFGNTNKATTQSMIALAKSYRELGRYDEAIALNQEALEARRKLYGDENPLTTDTWMSLANTQRANGQMDEAGEIAQKVFFQEREKLVANELGALNTMTNIAKVWFSQGRHRNAMQLLTECLERRTKVMGAKHRRTRDVAKTLDEWKAVLMAGENRPGVRARL